MIMKHCTKLQVSTVSRLVGEVITRFSDRQTDRQTIQIKMCLPQDGGDITTCIYVVILNEKKMCVVPTVLIGRGTRDFDPRK
jgi:hypothetical protein